MYNLQVQSKFIKAIVCHPLCLSCPPSPRFVYKTLKVLKVESELSNTPISVEFQRVFEDAILRRTQAGRLFHYRHFFIPKQPVPTPSVPKADHPTVPTSSSIDDDVLNVISAFENRHTVVSLRLNDSRNEVGLRLWTAAFRLADLLIRLGRVDITVGVRAVGTVTTGVGTADTILEKTDMSSPSKRIIIPSCKGKRSLELGAGVGLTSVIAATCCQFRCLNLTDHLPAVLDNLRYNLVDLNRLEVDYTKQPSGVSSDDSDGIIPDSASSDSGGSIFEIDSTQCESSDGSSLNCSSLDLGQQILGQQMVEQQPLGQQALGHPVDELAAKVISVSLLDWETTPDLHLELLGRTTTGQMGQGPVDIVFASDAVYDAHLTRHLIQTVHKLLQASVAARIKDEGLNRSSCPELPDNSRPEFPDNSCSIDAVPFPFMLMTVTRRSVDIIEVLLQECERARLQVLLLNEDLLISLSEESNLHDVMRGDDVSTYLIQLGT